MPETYHFVTDWRFKASLARTWDIVLDIERYPQWWKNFRRVKLISGDGRSVGSLIWCEVRGSLPYSLRYTLEVVAAERYRSVSLHSSGDLVGTGRWTFQELPGATGAIYHWDVATTNPILNLVAPLARGLLAHNHQQVMANGYAALRPQVEGS